MSINTKILFVSILFLATASFVAAEDLAQTCQPVSETNFSCQGMTGSNCKALLEKCAQYYEDESDRIAADMTKTSQQKKTLQNQITTLKSKVKNLEYQIKQGNVVIKDLTMQISETKTSINKITLQIEESKYQISNVLREVYQEDQKSVAEILLEGDLSDFFNNLTSLEGLNVRLGTLLKNTQDLQEYLYGQQEKMDDEKTQVENTVKIQSLQKKQNEQNKKEQEGLLKMTEAQYQAQLLEQKETQKKVSAIRARIFETIGVAKAPTFGEAYEIAKYVSGLTGVRPALILAVITQESNLGKNVGQCVVTNTATGAGKKISTNATFSKVMSPTRDVPKFLTITGNLGRDYSITPVSCPMSYGWGGAMGPAQFIPSTWMVYSDRIQALSNKTPDPWDIRDAFLAAGLYLGDYGAKKQTYNGEWSAAMIYFSGSTNKKYKFYGNSVMTIAAGYADDIAAIEGQ